MGLRGEVHDGVRPVPREDSGDGLRVANVGVLEGIVRRARNQGQRLEPAGIGQRVEIDDGAFLDRDEPPHHGRSDEAGAAGDQYLHGIAIPQQSEETQPPRTYCVFAGRTAPSALGLGP